MAADDRRELVFQNVEEIVAEAERLAAGEVRTIGKHSFPAILNHLALAQDVATGRITAPAPSLFMRLLMPLMKGMIINSKPLKPGVKLPAKSESFFWPDKELDVPSALQSFKESIDYYSSHGPLERHPVFGKMTRDESDQLTCRHAALHLGFVHPA